MINKYLVSTMICLGITPMLMAEEGANGCYSPTAVVGEPLDPCCINSVYPYPANISPTCGWDLYVSGEFLYFSVSKDIFPGAAGQFSLDGSGTIFLPQNSSYRPGFKISCGMDLGSVVLDATYLRYHPHTTSHYSAQPGTGLIYSFPEPQVGAPLFGQVRPLFQSIKSSFHFSMDSVVVSLQRPVYLGKRILMNLNYGIRGTWMGENWHFTATALNPPPPLSPPIPEGTSDGTTTIQHKSWAVGVNLGFVATALLPWHFQLISKLDLGLQYAEETKIALSASYPDLPANTLVPPPFGPVPPFLGNNTIRERGNGPHAQVWHQGEIGIGWGEYLCCDRYHVNISVSYNWILNHAFPISSANSPFGFDLGGLHNFSVHGISVGGRLDF